MEDVIMNDWVLQRQMVEDPDQAEKNEKKRKPNLQKKL